MDNNQKFDLWCIVELFGHDKVAGKCTEQEIAGTNFLRIEIPETPNQPSYTEFYGNKAIYSIKPVTEEIARQTANALNKAPISSWDIRTAIKKHNSLLAEKTAEGIEDAEEEAFDDMYN